MARIIDGDAWKAARAEIEEDAPVWKFGGEEFVLPASMPWDIVVAIAEDDAKAFVAAVKSLLGEKGYKRACALGAVRDDFLRLLLGCAEVYGYPPEASGSSSRSSKTGSRSLKRTSNGSTASTSGKSSGANGRPDGDGSST